MPVQLTVTQDYPALPAALFAVFGDPAYPPAKYRTLGALSCEVRTHRADDREIHVDLERLVCVDLDALPAIVRKLASAQQTMRHDTRWRRRGDGATGELAIEVVGKPVRIEGTADISPHEGGSRVIFRFEISSSVPLVGDKIARVFAGQVEAALARDHEFTRAWLEEHPAR